MNEYIYHFDSLKFLGKKLWQDSRLDNPKHS